MLFSITASVYNMLQQKGLLFIALCAAHGGSNPLNHLSYPCPESGVYIKEWKASA